MHVGSGQTARHAVDHVLVVGLQIGQRGRRPFQPHVGAMQAFGEIAGQAADGQEAWEKLNSAWKNYLVQWLRQQMKTNSARPLRTRL